MGDTFCILEILNFRQNVLLALRLSFSEKVGEFKFNTFNFLKKDTNLLELVTNTEVEQNIIQKSKDSGALMIKIMDLSKWIQVELIKELLNKRRWRKLSIIT